jgi:gliding motility-associated-like protein
MKKRTVIYVIPFLLFLSSNAQTPSCPSPYVYMDGGSTGPYLQYYDPGQPLSSTNPANTNIPNFGSGLTLMPNINGGTLSPTFYATQGGQFYYWSGAAWVNTGHSTGAQFAVNLGGCGSTLYNLDGITGNVYAYNGTGNATLLTTLSGFNSGGPFDLVTDCNCNFYVLNTTIPNQSLSMYNSAGALQCTYPLNGMPNTSAGGGFAIIGNQIYVKNNTATGFYTGTITPNAVNFTAVNGFTALPGDFASCPVCYPSVNLNGSTISPSVMLNCVTPTANLSVNSSASGATFLWGGPGILGSFTGSAVTVTLPGTYVCIISAGNCPPTQLTLTTSVASNISSVAAAVTPSGNICVSGNNTTKLFAQHSYSTDVVTWTGPSMIPVTGADSVIVNNPGTYTLIVTNLTNGCQGTALTTIAQIPTVSIAQSNHTVCLHNSNGSPNTITVTPSGASNYTLLTTSNYTTNTPNGPSMVCYPVSSASTNLNALATVTLVGANGTCIDTAITTFSIIANPNLSLSVNSASICPGGNHSFLASGATIYSWNGSPGLNTYVGNTVVATPVSTGTYAVMGSDNGCNSATKVATVTILPTPSVTIGPFSSTICLGSAVTLTATGNATSYTWSPGSSLLSASIGPTVSASPPITQVFSVLATLNTCTSSSSALVNVVQPPQMTLSSSTPTMCANNYNGSPNSINVYPQGASSYTLLGGNNLTVLFPNGPNIMQISPTGPSPQVPSVVSMTLLGTSGVCHVNLTHTVTVIPNPVLTIVPQSASICPGQSQGFTAQGASSYTWLPANNYTVSGASMVANPFFNSFYSVVGNDGDCYSAVKNAVLVVLPAPNVSIDPTATVCVGSSVKLTVGGDATSYNWYPSSNLSSPYGHSVMASPVTTQNYTVIGTFNTCSNQAVITVSAIPMPVLTAGVLEPYVCSGMGAHVYASGANSFQWYPTASLNNSSGGMVIASPNENTTYTVHGYNGICTGSATVLVKTVPRPQMEVLITANQVCKGASVEFSVSGANSYTWQPQQDMFPTGTNTHVIMVPKTSTNYTVFGANTIGSVSCLQQLSYSVVVVQEIKPVVAPGLNLCYGDKTTLYAQGGNTFSWTPSEGLNSTNDSRIVANPTVTTVYTVNVSENHFCGVNATVMVNVTPRPKVFAGRDTSYNVNEAIFIEARGTGTVTWYTGEGIVCRSCDRTQVYPTRSGCYAVEAKNEYGCIAFDDICIELTEDFTIYIPDAFSPNNDGLNDVFLIYGDNISSVYMDVYNRWGTLIFSSHDYTQGWDGKYKGAVCEPGIYNYTIRYTGLDRKKYVKTGYITLTH